MQKKKAAGLPGRRGSLYPRNLGAQGSQKQSAMASTQDEDSRPGILTTCAACAIRIPHTAPRCGRCHTRYCGSACQTAHWGQGHKELCKMIKRGGFAEQYHADKMYKAAVAEAVAAAAEDAVGQTCYICKEGPGEEGLAASGCACRGTAGFVHIKCRARQAQVLVEEGLENNLPMDSRWAVWDHCPLCHQYIVGPMKHALGWACWRSYVRKPDGQLRARATEMLGYGLQHNDRNEEAVAVLEATMALIRRVGEESFIRTEIIDCLANCYTRLGRDEFALRLRSKAYEDTKASYGEAHPDTLRRAINLGDSLSGAEEKSWFRKQANIARTALGDDDSLTIQLRASLALSLGKSPFERHCNQYELRVLESYRTDLEESVAIFTDVILRAQRQFGGQHPRTIIYADYLKETQTVLAGINSTLSNPASD